jgi:hypothetical protein
VLAEVYNWFANGVDPADLKEAEAGCAPNIVLEARIRRTAPSQAASPKRWPDQILSI